MCPAPCVRRFFEWKRGKEGKQPYFIYFPQGSPHTETDIKPETKQELKTQQIKPDPQSSLAQGTKLEPVKKPDPDHHSSSAQVAKLEPVDIKPDSEEPASVQARRDTDAVELVPSSGELAVPRKTQKQEIKTEAEEAGAGNHANETKKSVAPEQGPRKQATERTCFEVASDSAHTEDDGTKNNCHDFCFQTLHRLKTKI